MKDDTGESLSIYSIISSKSSTREGDNITLNEEITKALCQEKKKTATPLLSKVALRMTRRKDFPQLVLI